LYIQEVISPIIFIEENTEALEVVYAVTFTVNLQNVQTIPEKYFPSGDDIEVG